MKILAVFAVFVLLHGGGWAAAHLYQERHREPVLLVVDTSYAMKPKFAAMQAWLEDYAASSRYKNISIGTDKAMLGKLADLKSMQIVFRTAFGSLNADNLARYAGEPAKKRILLSDGAVQPAGWEVVKF